MAMEELLQLINQKLSQDGITLCPSRSGRMVEDRGEFYVELHGKLLATNIDPLVWGRELGILAN